MNTAVPVFPSDAAPAQPGTSWGAIFAGATGAAALSLILLVLGTGLGFAAISPWSDRGADAGTLGAAAIVWLAATQIAASALGGYLAGRLRTRWSALHGDEVYFRDTAHGFIAWGLSTLLVAALLSTAVGSALKGGAQAGATVAGAAAQGGMVAGAAAAPGGIAAAMPADLGLRYAVDTMLRGSAPNPDDRDATHREVLTIVASSLRSGTLADEDRRYLGQVVAQRTGQAPADAERRVGDAFARLKATMDDAATKAREAADTARRNAAHAALWMFVALLAGAFVASLSATWGGRQRDRHD